MLKAICPIGSTVAMTDINENIVNSYAYTPFGVLTESETITQPFKYVGQYGVMHEPNGLYYMRARYYDPELGRFISEDPIGFEGGTINLYEYVKNNPVLFNDPSGLLSFGGGFGGFAGIFGGFFNISYVSCCENGVKHHYTILQYAYGLGIGLEVGGRISPSGIIGPSSCPVKEGTVKYVCAAGAYYGGLSGCVPGENRLFDFSGGSWSIIGGIGAYGGSFSVTTKILQDVPSGRCCEKGE